MMHARMIAGALVGMLVAVGSVQAKPLYITVPRTFSPVENPAIDVAFSGNSPVELRVLKPDNLEEFIKSQVDIRRSYRAPGTQYNPGHALSAGLNGLHNPGQFLLYAIHPKLREEISPSLPKAETVPWNGPLARVAKGAEKLVGIPAGMTLVRSEWLNLDLGGEDREFNVPGYENWFGYRSGFMERHVLLAPLPAGVYVLQLVQDKLEGQVVLVITGQTVQVKQTDGEVLVRAAGLDQRPVEGAQVQVMLQNGKGPTGKTDDMGEVRLKVADTRLLLTVRKDNDVALVDTDFYSTLAVTPDVFIYSDRPIYKPGDVVRFRGVLRQPDSMLARLFMPRQKSVQVQLVSDAGTVSTRANVDEYAAFSGQLTVPGEMGAGVVRLVATVDNRPHNAEARVQQYVKPTFYVEVLAEEETVTPGGKLKAKLRARRYSGGAPKDTAYEVFLYRVMVDAPAWVDDAGMGGQGSAVTYGSASTTEGKLSVPERLYSSVEARNESGDDPWANAARFDANGEAELEIPVPALGSGEDRLPYRYTLVVRARDDQGSFANGSKAYFLSRCQVMGLVRPNAKVVKQKGEAMVSVRATTLGGKPYGETQGNLTFKLVKGDGSEKSLGTQALKTDADGVWRGPVPTTEIGTVVAEVTLHDKAGVPWSGAESLLVVGDGGEAVARVANLTLEALGGVLEPGEQGEVIALFPDAWGSGLSNRGPVWVTLSGARLYDTQLLDVRGQTLVHRFDVKESFGSAVYVSVAYPTSRGRWEERTVPFRIVPQQRMLKVSVKADSPEVQPLSNQQLRFLVTDYQGRGVSAQLSVSVVDKAIYALQQEFRPKVLDFFYPIARNNVATFYSSDFQAYGYGEAVARAMNRVNPYAFSAIKPPTRQPKAKDEDTAYWNPAVVTDSQGHAKVSFQMPGNQTLWTVTVVAADASGRFGETTYEFASRGTMSLYAALPQFLRHGDQVHGSVRLSRGAEGKGTANYKVEIAASGGVTGETVRQDVALEPKAERIVPVSVTANGPGDGTVAVSVRGTDAMVDRRIIPVREAVLEEQVQASAWGGGDLTLALPAGAKVKSAELVLQPTLVDAALHNLRDLLTYPYGCLEQLLSTTIPNIAVYRTLEKTNGFESLTPEDRALMAEARFRADQGVQRILALAVKGGGFTWFSGYSTPSLPLTLMALEGMSYAVEAGLVPKDDPRIMESASWLVNQGDLPFTAEATRTYVLAKLEGSRHAARVRALVEKAGTGDLYALALAVLASEYAGVDKEPELNQRVASLVKQSQEGVVQLANWNPEGEWYWSYPLRRIGMTAILLHAASKANGDVAQVRKRTLQMLNAGEELSTFERSTALLHSLWLIEKDAKEMRRMTPPAVDAKGGNVKLEPRGSGLAAVVPASVTKVFVGDFDGVAMLRAQVDTPLDLVQEQSQGFMLARRYFVLRNGEKVALESGQTVTQGEEVFVQLELDAHEGDEWRRQRSAYYVVEDQVPAGFVPIQEDKPYRSAPFNLPLEHEALKRRTLGSERVTFFFDEPAPWSRSPRTVGYVMRAQFPGTFVMGPATAVDMYAARVKARTPSARLTVSPSARP